jgi:hypothetical protein
MANITVTSVGDSIPTIVAAEALGALKANCVMSRLVARDWENEVASYGQTVTIPLRSAFTAQSKSADATVTLQAPTDSALSLTLNQHYEISFLFEDVARMLERPDQFAGWMADAVKVLAEKIDATLTGLYSGLSQTIDASAGLDESDFRNARRLLNVAKAPMTDRYAVLHPDADYEALGIEKITNRDYAESLGQMAANSLIGRAFGFDIFMDQNVTVATTCKNLFFQKYAFVAAFRPMAIASPGLGVQQVTLNEDGIGLRVTRSYNPSYLGEQMTIDCLWGVAELRDAFGVAVSTADIA